MEIVTITKNPNQKREILNLKPKIENTIYNRKGKIQKANLKIENEFYTIEECKIIDFSKPLLDGIMLYEKSETDFMKRLVFCDKYADVFLTRMIETENFDALFQIKIYEEAYLISGFERTPFLIRNDAAFNRINSFTGMPITKAITKELFYTQAKTVRKTAEGDFYVGYFIDEGAKVSELFLRLGKSFDRLSTHSIAETKRLKTEYKTALEKCLFMDDNGSVIPDKWWEYLKTKNQNTK